MRLNLALLWADNNCVRVPGKQFHLSPEIHRRDEVIQEQECYQLRQLESSDTPRRGHVGPPRGDLNHNFS